MMLGRARRHRLDGLASVVSMSDIPYSLLISAGDSPGVLREIAGVIARHEVNIRSLHTLDNRQGQARLYVELEPFGDPGTLLAEIRALAVVHSAVETSPLLAIYGKRVIIMGGGAQVGQVAVGAISEADRHNIRGERISVDTIPLVGEQELAAAVRAVARLPRAEALVLAGALMGGAITEAVRELQQQGVIVIALKMAGSVRQVADLVVTDPLQAGVMAVMAVADTATFDVARQRHREY
jgi:energy-converting hydrogenase B subunit Q